MKIITSRNTGDFFYFNDKNKYNFAKTYVLAKSGVLGIEPKTLLDLAIKNIRIEILTNSSNPG